MIASLSIFERLKVALQYRRNQEMIVTPRDEEILKAVWYYRYITARDLNNLFFAKTSITHMREILANLSGGADLQTNTYLCRFPLPALNGTREKVYVLGAKGRRVLTQMGLPATWYFRPHKLKFLSTGYVTHNLILTRTLIAAYCWASAHPDFSLVGKHICYEPPGKVIPDGYLLFEEQTSNGVYEQPVMIELDRGMEQKIQFRAHVRGRINYLQSGEYKKTFQTDVATIAYVTTGQTPEYRETRRKAMCLWMRELLRDMQLKQWDNVFKVASVEFKTLYDYSLFETEAWYKPDSSTAVRLFD
jgi:hypothetical protein